METFADKLRAFGLAVGVHLLCVLALVVGLAWTRAARPVSVPGTVIEATLVAYTPPAARPARPPVPKPAQPRPEPARPEPPKPEAEVDPRPPAPPRADDTVDQERIDRLALEQAENARREQEERRRREQQELEAEERLTKMERERQEQLRQLEEIRRKREDAERRRRVEAQRLAQLEDRAREARVADQRQAERERMEQLLAQEQREGAQAGNEGTDDSLLARYLFTIQSQVTQNWLRPDNTPAGLRCTLRITQIPGGEVIEATVIAPCNGDDLTRRSLEAAVMRAQPLPYQGYESVFQRTLTFNFRYDG